MLEFKFNKAPLISSEQNVRGVCETRRGKTHSQAIDMWMLMCSVWLGCCLLTEVKRANLQTALA